MIGGAFEGVQDQVSPFGYKRGEGIDAGAGEPEWIVTRERFKYDTIFETLNPCDGKITGAGKASPHTIVSLDTFYFKQSVSMRNIQMMLISANCCTFFHFLLHPSLSHRFKYHS